MAVIAANEVFEGRRGSFKEEGLKKVARPPVVIDF